jgi:cysteine desulfurase / selenocysteine lyase
MHLGVKMNRDKVRDEFELTKTDKLYLNHAAKSPIPNYVAKSMHQYIDKCRSENIEYYPNCIDENKEFKSLIAELINANEHQIAISLNTSTGINLCVDHINWKKDDEIIIYSKDFPANIFPFLKLKEQYGVKINVVRDDDFILEEDKIIGLISKKTRLITVSHVQFLSGQVIDLEKIGNICKENDILFVVDSIQSCGAIHLDVKKYHIDFLANGGHKWMIFPSGMGFIYFSEKFKRLNNHYYHGWLDYENPFDLFNWKRKKYDDGKQFELGTAQEMLINAAIASLKFRNEVGVENIHNRIKSLRESLKVNLTKLNLEILDHNEKNFQSGIISFRHKSAGKLYKDLMSMGITIAIREGTLRVSPHFYNNENDIDCFIEKLKKRI